MTTNYSEKITVRHVAVVWWPLAASWLLMGMEVPALSAVMARLADPEIHLAAYGGVIFPVSLLIEAPIIMLLAASTAMCRDWASYRLVHRFMRVSGAVLTLLHMAVAFTPLFDLIVGGLMGAPEEIREPARLGFRIMTPWTWSIGYRRFQQGNLIRDGRTGLVMRGTAVRLLADGLMLWLGYHLRLPGVAAATSAAVAGVISEAVFIGIAVRPSLRRLREAPPVEPALTLRAFTTFYVPLALTSLLTLLGMPIASAAMSRMPRPIESLAVWPVVNGLVFTLRSVGFAYNEVVVSMLERRGSVAPLRRFASLLALVTTGIIAVLAVTPLSRIWFREVAALAPPLAAMATIAVGISCAMPALSVVQSWYQGAIVHSHKTRGITEAVAVFLVAITVFLAAGVLYGRLTGLFAGIIAWTLANIAQNVWLRKRALDSIRAVTQRDRRLAAAEIPA